MSIKNTKCAQKTAALKLLKVSLEKKLIQEKYKQIELKKWINVLKLRYAELYQRSVLERAATEKSFEVFFIQQEENRKEISRELHDEVGQVLTAINLELEVLIKEASSDSLKIKERILNTQKLVEDSVEIVHRFARELRPMILDDLGIVYAIKSYLKEFQKLYKIPVIFKSNSKFSNINDIPKTVLFRVVQESLTNIAKHSKATRASVHLKRVNKNILLDIADNGRSFNVNSLSSSIRNKRLGLIGMSERVRLAGGTLLIKSSKGKGTTVRAEIPIQAIKR
ncbi:MAG: sensor histidine kinase [Bacteriovorax sp.]|nr:sensor histidine kinase [Bacteriovorax sp.]